MPIYEYRCDECGEQFERLVRSLSSAGKIECPRCGSHKVEKAISRCGRAGAGEGSDSLAASSCAPTGG